MNEPFSALKHVLDVLKIGAGDTVYVASDITLLLNVTRKKYGIRTTEERNSFLHEFIDTLKDIITEQGTLLFPAFTWEPCRSAAFDVRFTKSEVGALNNWVLQHCPEFMRTAHPMYSFLVWGRDAEKLVAMDNESGWGVDSPFGYFHREHAKMLLLDVHLKQCYTFMHYVEEQIHVPFRYMKSFRMSYIDRNGAESSRCYRMFVRDLAIDSDPFEPDEFLLKSGIMVEGMWLDIPVRVIDMAESYSIYENDLLNNKGKMCYIFSGYELDWENKQTHPDDLNH